jgi:hypothetical protein
LPLLSQSTRQFRCGKGGDASPAIAGRYIASWAGVPRLFGAGKAAICYGALITDLDQGVTNGGDEQQWDLASATASEHAAGGKKTGGRPAAP